MTQVDIVFALKALPPFDRLRDTELTLIASIGRVLHYEPGATVHPDEQPFHRLYLRLTGDWSAAAQPAPAILGVGSLLFGNPAPGPIVAGPAGAVAVSIQKSQFHTIVNETPELLLGFLQQPAGRTAGTFL